MSRKSAISAREMFVVRTMFALLLLLVVVFASATFLPDPHSVATLRNVAANGLTAVIGALVGAVTTMVGYKTSADN